MDPAAHEKRAHPRILVFRPLLYQSDIYPKTRMAFTKDLSLGGARIEDASSLYTHERLSLWFSLQPRVIPCRGRVAHIQQVGEKFSAGIRFESMTDEDRTALSQYLSDLMEKNRQP